MIGIKIHRARLIGINARVGGEFGEEIHCLGIIPLEGGKSLPAADVKGLGGLIGFADRKNKDK